MNEKNISEAGMGSVFLQSSLLPAANSKNDCVN